MSASERIGEQAGSRAAVALWAAAVLFLAVGVAKLALYADFTADSGAGCRSEQNPGFTAACEQFAPVAWYGPYWLAVAGSIVFALLFAAAAVLADRGRRPVRFAMAATLLAIALAVVPGVFDLDWRFAVAAASEADAWVAEYVRDGVPSWYGPVETALLVLAAVAALLGAEWLRRSPARQ
ncbi:hypothetical protein [Glycomyces endophyticus]